LLDRKLINLRDIQIVNEDELKNIENYVVVKNFKQSVNNALPGELFSSLREYNAVILNEVLSQNKLTYNSFISLTLQLLEDQPTLLELYRNVYTKIIIDEFQDTNYLNMKLIELLLHEDIRM